jgi:transcriptional regulator with XRE-family HTH domain
MPTRKRQIRHAAIVQSFADRLKAIRISREMTQKDLAEKAILPVSYVSKLEAAGAAPGIDLLERLAQALRVNVGDLLPAPAEPETPESSQARAKSLFSEVLTKAGPETVRMINLFLARMSDSPATRR